MGNDGCMTQRNVAVREFRSRVTSACRMGRLIGCKIGELRPSTFRHEICVEISFANNFIEVRR